MCLNHQLFRVALVASGLLFGLSVFAWVQAVRLPDYANYWEWRDGWHIGVRNTGKLDHPIWWDTHAFAGRFPDRGVRVWPTMGPYSDMLHNPYRFPDIRARSIRILWPFAASLVVPSIWIVFRARKTVKVRGFPVGSQPADAVGRVGG